MATLSDVTDKIAQRIQDDAGIMTEELREAAVAEALVAYQRTRPRVLIADMAGNGTDTYALPASWVAGYSYVLSLELPSGEMPPAYMGEGDYVIYQSATSTYTLRLLFAAPGVTQTLRLRYTGAHTASTLPGGDVEAVANKGAAICCTWLAAHYAQQGEATLTADVTGRESRVRQYQALAQSFEMAYALHLGLNSANGQVQVSAASSVLEWNSYGSYGRHLTHD